MKPVLKIKECLYPECGVELSKDYVMSNRLWLTATELSNLTLKFIFGLAANGKVKIPNFRCMAKWLCNTLTSQL